MQTVMRGLEWLRRLLQQLGPYLILEIVLPGGTLFALLLFLYRRRSTGLIPAWVLVPSWRPKWAGNTWWPEWLPDTAIPMSNSASPNRL
jgi:hypothetical protein